MKRKSGRKPLSISEKLNSAITVHQKGDLSQAEALYENVIRLAPKLPHALHMLGVLYSQIGDDRAIDLLRKSIKYAPHRYDYLFNLGRAYFDNNNFDDAITAYQKFISYFPDDPEVFYWLARSLHAKKEFDQAVIFYQRAVEKFPGRIDFLNSLGRVFNDKGDFEQALVCYKQVLSLSPNDFVTLNNLGDTLRKLNNLDGAVSCFKKAISIDKNSVGVHIKLGATLLDYGKLDESFTILQHALSLDSGSAELHANIGNTLLAQGKPKEALTSFRQAFSLEPDFLPAFSKVLLCLQLIANRPASYYLAEASRYGKQVSAKVKKRFSTWNCSAKPERLRIGLVSGDFWSHPVGYFLENMLANIDSSKLDLIAYQTNDKGDELTARIRPRFVAWQSLQNKSDEEAARLIHNDGVHILLDLSGHTCNNRLPVFAWKPAPVQATWLGYFASTGVTEIDYIVTDPISVPESQRNQFTERVWELPDTRICFSPPVFSAELPVTPLPALQNRYITFGCFQVLPKINDELLTCWGKIFRELPQARLILQNKSLDSPTVCEQLQRRLTRFGIDRKQVTLNKSTQRVEYLKAHGLIDILLDTFPFPGGTTTCEALWMGVPTVTLAGNNMITRQGASLLTCAGFPDWVASDSESYVTKAISHATDIKKLSRLRSGLRQQVMASPLMDGQRFTRNFETAMWGMWYRFQDKN